jgi:hypothetical protein
MAEGFCKGTGKTNHRSSPPQDYLEGSESRFFFKQFRFPAYLRTILLSSIGIALICGNFGLNHYSPALAQEVLLAEINGQVLSKLDETPIPEASVRLIDFGLTTYTDNNGYFSISNLAIPEFIHPTTISIQASGYGVWRIEGVRLVATDTLILEAKLETEPTTIIVPGINPDRDFKPDLLQAYMLQPASALSQMDLPLPKSIRVRITNNVAVCNLNASYTVEVVDFKEYVRNVLPNEWYVTWPAESLRAGAMAAKMYAWQLQADGGRYDDADVFDSVCDQVYIPGVAYGSTNRAIDFTWNWRLTHSDDGTLFRTHYLDWFWRCQDYEWDGYCMGQWDTYYHATGNNGYDKLTWDEMLFEYYWDSELSYIPHLPPANFHLRFYGNAWGDYDRVKILIDDSQNGNLPIDVGNTDFTIEWWMKALSSENTSPSCTPGEEHWMDGNVILDRDVPGDGDYGEYGISIMDGRIAFGVNNGSTSQTLCGTIPISDNRWHHVALTRHFEDGLMQIFIDGVLDAEVVGPTGDISYRDGRTPENPDQDPYLILGARKLDQGLAFSGWIDEFRISNTIRYTDSFSLPGEPFITDENTLALYHFDTGYGNLIQDHSGAVDGPSNGIRIYGGDPKNGPEWEVSSLFLFRNFFFPLIIH